MNRENIVKKVMATVAVMCLVGTAAIADSDVTAEKQVAESSFPTEWASDSRADVVQLPNIAKITASNTYNITDYGASTSSSDNASAIQAAIDAVPSTGGMVVVPAGTWLSGPIKVKSKMVLHLSAGATLKLLPYGTYPSSNAYKDYRGSYANFISADGTANDVIIEGEGVTSVIDGQGAAWWKAVEDEGKFTRPSLIRLQKGARHLFRNIKLLNSPGTNLTLGQNGNANNMTVHDVIIVAPASTLGKGKASHNTDGIPVWGPYVNIYDCNISTGDDNVVVDTNGRYVHAWNITCGSGHGMSIGSYTVNLHHIIYEDITFNQTETGFRIKTSNDRSGNDYSGTSDNGAVHDLIFRNSTMYGVGDPIKLTCLYDADPADPSTVATSTVTKTTPEYRDFLFQNITATGTPFSSSFKYGNPIYIYGRPESYIHDITFDNVSIDAQKGMFMAYCKDIHFINGCNIVNTAGTGDFSKQYKATYTGSYNSVSTAVLSSKTCEASKKDASPWAFGGGYTISNAKGKTYDPSATEPYIKYSASVQYTITLPEGVYVKAVQFDGFNNMKTDDTNPLDAYISELGGTTYGETGYVFPQDKSTVSRKIDLSTTASGTLTFTPAGKQICATITLFTTDTPSGIVNVNDNLNPNGNRVIKVMDPNTKRLTIAGYDEAGRRVK